MSLLVALTLGVSAIAGACGIPLVIQVVVTKNNSLNTSWIYFCRLPLILVCQIAGIIVGSVSGGWVFSALVKQHPYGDVGYQPFMVAGMEMGALVGTILGWTFVFWPSNPGRARSAVCPQAEPGDK